MARFGRRSRHQADLAPGVGVVFETIALHPDDAEALAGRRPHDDPALQRLVDGGAELLEPLHLGGDIVRLDVDVHAAFVIDTLELDPACRIGGPNYARVGSVVTFG